MMPLPATIQNVARVIYQVLHIPYNMHMYSMLLLSTTSCAFGFEGRNWHMPSSVLGHWSPGGVLLVLHQGRFAAICAMNLAGNT
jgi:hypothetical protein